MTGTGSNIGGLIGFNSTGGVVSTSYFDMQTTGQVNGVGNNASASGVTGRTTSQARLASITPAGTSRPSGTSPPTCGPSCARKRRR
ncbi:hypothetical protein V6L77_01155 [Pannonibacter sp. Pt2-lr]